MRKHIFDVYGYDRHKEELDFYSWVAKEANIDRQVAKTILLAKSYAVSESNMVRTLYITQEDLNSFNERFKDADHSLRID